MISNNDKIDVENVEISSKTQLLLFQTNDPDKTMISEKILYENCYHLCVKQNKSDFVLSPCLNFVSIRNPNTL